MGPQNHFERVRALVSRNSGAPESQITPETRLAEDLGVAGDDGEDLLIAFGDEFGIDVTDVAFIDYFGGETLFQSETNNLFTPFAAAAFPRFRAFARRAVRGRRSVRVRDLVSIARAGKWSRPPVFPADNDPTRFGIYTFLMASGSLVLPVLVGLWRYAISDVAAPSALGTAFILFAAILVILAIRFLFTLPWLRRLDAAATHEENAGLTSEHQAPSRAFPRSAAPRP
ncbi:MAG: DUF1493 family protein [Paracoccaceae bacterium]|nr:DUF1493 family protein [Paracoccaceae bacterium]